MMLWHTKVPLQGSRFGRKCSGFTGGTFAGEEVTLDGDVLELVAKFSYLGDVLSYGREVQKAITVRIKCG